jgi:hypothetical protein
MGKGDGEAAEAKGNEGRRTGLLVKDTSETASRKPRPTRPHRAHNKGTNESTNA